MWPQAMGYTFFQKKMFRTFAITSIFTPLMANSRNSTNPMIGRLNERKRLRDLLETNESELVAIMGRRRVGKTFLVKNVYQEELVFHITGIQQAKRKVQLENFVEARNTFFKKSKSLDSPQNWFQAFSQLKGLLGNATGKKKVLFFDELPWLATGSTEFLKTFDHFWNSWAVNQNVIVVICGSATSWMISNIIKDIGGLHNRVTQRLHLMPFTLRETESYFASRHIQMPRYSIVQIYMAMGGIPFYLREVKRDESAVQSIDRIFFGKQASLHGEFDNLYKALFKNNQRHIEVVRALAKQWKGLTRQEIIDTTSFYTGGGLSAILDELESSHFIQSYVPYGKKERDKIYRLVDEYSLFYIRFIEPNKNQERYWSKKYNTPVVKTWSGYAFESLCMKHVEGIKKKLGISGIYTLEASFVKRTDKATAGCQIDMLIDRADNAINICEMKFYDGQYTLTAADGKELQQKRNVFQLVTGTKKQLFITLITTYGIYPNKYAHIVDNQIEMDALFL
jgi:uncharacterized protein